MIVEELLLPLLKEELLLLQQLLLHQWTEIVELLLEVGWELLRVDWDPSSQLVQESRVQLVSDLVDECRIDLVD